MRFLIANTSDFNPKEDAIDFAELRPVDKYMLVKFNELVKQIRTAYDNYSFMTVYKSIINFITNDLSSFYLDFAKDVVYIEAANSPERRSMQTVMYVILKDLVKRQKKHGLTWNMNQKILLILQKCQKQQKFLEVKNC